MAVTTDHPQAEPGQHAKGPDLDPPALAEALVQAGDLEAQERRLAAAVRRMDARDQDRLAGALKEQADQLMRVDIDRCLRVADLGVELARLTGNPLHRAEALLAGANAHTIGLGQHERALALYDEAAEIYGACGRLVEQARSQIGKIYALANLGRYDDAWAAGSWASDVLEEQGELFTLARLTVNLAIMRGRLNQDAEALALFDRARALYRQLGAEGQEHWARAELNRGIVLRNLGRFEDAIQASEIALDIHRRLGQRVATARTQQSLAITYFAQGRYNEALALLDEAQQAFLADGRQRHAMLVDLFISDCLLQLRRFASVLEKCARVRALFSEMGNQLEVAQAILNEASAYVGLGRLDDALDSLTEARGLFEVEGNLVAVADADLQIAAALLERGEAQESLALARACAAIFETHELPIWRARADLVAARAAIALHDLELADRLVVQALSTGEGHNTPALTYQSHYLQGRLDIARGDLDRGLAAYARAIEELERLCGRLMVEFRADFVENKEHLYQDAVLLCARLERPALGLEYAERAKSRALLSLLAHRLDLSIRARSASDRPLVDEIIRLREARDRLCREWETGEGLGSRGEVVQMLGASRAKEQEVLVLEKQITDLWHRLLVRNADYARDAALCRVRTEPVQPYLDPGTLLVEYFFARDRLVAFLASADAVQVRVLPVDVAQVQRPLQLLWMNLKAASARPGRMAGLTDSGRRVLQGLYRILVAPFADDLAHYGRLVVVSHGVLHYLPFQLLHDGEAYLIERYEISHLPGASLMRYCRETRPAQAGLVAVGHSCEGRLPYAVQEAQSVARTWEGEVFLEDAATRACVREAASRGRILHLATHGEFRPDNPLFSGLALADGWLTTLDVFALPLRASLVTLSACQTGRSVVGGGDELLGIMRAFLAAGTASLVLTLWAVEDRSTALLMEAFYQGLAEGRTKGAALRHAQLHFLQDQAEQEGYRHPYFWGPFFLVGDPGAV